MTHRRTIACVAWPFMLVLTGCPSSSPAGEGEGENSEGEGDGGEGEGGEGEGGEGEGEGEQADPFVAQLPEAVGVITGGSYALDLSIVRRPGFTEPVFVVALNPPPELSFAASTIGQNQSAGTLPVNVADGAVDGTSINVDVRFEAGGFSVVEPINFVISSYQLAVTFPPDEVLISPGQSRDVPIALTTSVANASMDVEVLGLPDGVSAAPLLVSANSMGVLVLTASENASSGDEVQATVVSHVNVPGVPVYDVEQPITVRVTPPPSFGAVADIDNLDLAVGGAAQTVTVTVTRGGTLADITLSATAPATVVVQGSTLVNGATVGTLSIGALGTDPLALPRTININVTDGISVVEVPVVVSSYNPNVGLSDVLGPPFRYGIVRAGPFQADGFIHCDETDCVRITANNAAVTKMSLTGGPVLSFGVASIGGNLAAAARADGGIVVATNAMGGIRLTRVLNATGLVDTAFGAAGTVLVHPTVGDVVAPISPNGGTTALEKMPDGWAVVVPGIASGTLVVVRLLEDGSLSPNFDGDGVLSVPIPGTDATVMLSHDGDALFMARGRGASEVLITKLLASGAVDIGFGQAGHSAFASCGTTSRGLFLQAASLLYVGYGPDCGLAAHYLSTTTGAVNTNFGVDGMVTAMAPGFSLVAVMPDGDGLVGVGNASPFVSTVLFRLVPSGNGWVHHDSSPVEISVSGGLQEETPVSIARGPEDTVLVGAFHGIDGHLMAFVPTR